MSDYSDYDFDDTESIETTWGIFSVGDRVEVISTNEEWGYFAEQEADDEAGTPYYPADEGEVVGFSYIPGGLFGHERTAVYVAFDGRDPIEVQPADVMVLA